VSAARAWSALPLAAAGLAAVTAVALAAAPCAIAGEAPPPAPAPATVPAPTAAPAPVPHEPHLANVRQLTFGGENAEAYFSFDGRKLILQRTGEGLQCDQIFTMNVDGSDLRMVSSGKGRTTCAYWFPDGKRILYASTHLGGDACPPPPDRTHGYVWAVYADYDLFTADADGSGLRRLTDTPGYDAEAVVSPDGKRILFTSQRDGDLDLYSMNLDGSDVRRLTDRPGYDGGGFFSRDSKRIVWRAWYPPDSTSLAEYRTLLARGLVKPSRMELWVMNADGSDKRQVTNLGGANFAPFFTPDGGRILFSSNHRDPKGRNFEIYMVNLDGSGLEAVTDAPPFNGFPMFSPDGRRLVFASNRGGKVRGETDIFIADWKETAGAR
jgi:Tol biopolymer transport system component